MPQGAYPVTLLAKSAPLRLEPGLKGILHVDFLTGGSGTPPSDAAGMTIMVLATQGDSTYFIAQTGASWNLAAVA